MAPQKHRILVVALEDLSQPHPRNRQTETIIGPMPRQWSLWRHVNSDRRLGGAEDVVVSTRTWVCIFTHIIIYQYIHIYTEESPSGEDVVFSGSLPKKTMMPSQVLLSQLDSSIEHNHWDNCPAWWTWIEDPQNQMQTTKS